MPGHTVEFREAGRTDTADDVTLLAGILVAQTAIELALDPALVAAIRQEFDERRGGVTKRPGAVLRSGRAPCWTSCRTGGAPEWTVGRGPAATVPGG